MSRKPTAAATGPRARLEIEFEQPHLLGPLFGEFDRNGDHRLLECGVALGDDRKQQKEQEEEAEADCSHAVEAEAAFGGIAATQADIAALRLGGST
jgi:hypothetical protein